MTAQELARWLDDYLETGRIPDYAGAWNGLQVDRDGPVKRIAFAVDAAQATIDAAVDRGADLLIVHHGLFWDGNPTVTGRRHRRLAALLKANVGVYSSHLPLDAHEQVGNNAVLAHAAGITIDGRFASCKGVEIGITGTIDIRREALGARLDELLGGRVMMIPGGPEKIRRVGVVTGSGASHLGAAREAGLDALITGEGSHHHYFDSMEGGVNLFLGGHYATESWGLKALARKLADEFDLDWEFIDHPTGL
ncbi:MAG: Nif3-like dinuclear metal center hexameric protein [Gemmatimonadota bacterium]|jgi:dinuclear metal center YbgI/SA1388 family protein|nr:Nif3-like dinuclear metal center hexameric protein [Gemmatimonadota bacterium]